MPLDAFYLQKEGRTPPNDTRYNPDGKGTPSLSAPIAEVLTGGSLALAHVGTPALVRRIEVE